MLWKNPAAKDLAALASSTTDLLELDVMFDELGTSSSISRYDKSAQSTKKDKPASVGANSTRAKKYTCESKLKKYISRLCVCHTKMGKSPTLGIFQSNLGKADETLESLGKIS